jgi:hypothetical protein
MRTFFYLATKRPKDLADEEVVAERTFAAVQ